MTDREADELTNEMLLRWQLQLEGKHMVPFILVCIDPDRAAAGGAQALSMLVPTDQPPEDLAAVLVQCTLACRGKGWVSIERGGK